MNKLKIIYDVVRKMRDKDSMKGTLKAEGQKDQEKIFSINNTFERSNLDGQVKCIHSFHNHHHAEHAGGLRERLSRISAVLGILSGIKLEEKGDRSVILSLESADIPKEIKSDIHEMIKHGRDYHQQMDVNNQHHMFMKEFHGIENIDFSLNVFINKDSEVEKVTIDANGERHDEKNERHGMNLTAKLCLE